MREYITDEEFTTLLEDIVYKLQNGEIEACSKLLQQVIKDTEEQERYIDRTYINEVKVRKRLSKIADITTMLEKMTNEQIDNVHSYTVNEFDEPNHEAEALAAILQLSKKCVKDE